MNGNKLINLSMAVALSISLMVPVSVFCEDMLIIEDGSFNTTFTVTDTGRVKTTNIYQTEGIWPGFWLEEIDDGQKGAFFVLDKGFVQMQRRGTGYGAYEGAPMRVAIMAPADAFSIDSSGYVGIGTRYPGYPLQMKGGAYTDGTSWVDASSREYKDDINNLSASTAMETLDGLNPVTFKYKQDLEKTEVGFIAEEVPELVATKDRKGLSAMDIVAVLTKVVQEQQKTIKELESKLGQLETAMQFKQDKDADLVKVNIE